MDAISTEFSLNQLIENQIYEDKSIDYKLTLPSNSDEDKKEFLADVSSFANTIGGHVIIGMSEDKGMPIGLPGVEIDDPDKTKLRLEEIIQEGIAPRIAGISIQPIKLENGNWAIGIYIPRSWSAPHVVSFKKSSRFYARNSAGKYQLDVQEIRQSFLLSENTAQKIRDFRIDRVAKIGIGDTPIAMKDDTKIILHCIPLSAFQTSQSLEIQKIPIAFMTKSSKFTSFNRFNLDGILFYNSIQNTKEYAQIFRNGIVEYVNRCSIKPLSPGNDSSSKMLVSPSFESELIKQTSDILSFQKSINLAPPIYVIISITDARGLNIRTQNGILNDDNFGIDRDVILISEVFLENYPSDLPDIASQLKPAFDAIWNSVGWSGSINYSEDGTWKPKR